MKRRIFIKKSGTSLLALSTISISGIIVSTCSPSNDDIFEDGYYDNGYYNDVYYNDGYYSDGYYDDGYYDDGYYDDGYYEDGYYDDGYYDDGYYDDGYYDDGYYGDPGTLTGILSAGTWFVETYIDSGSNQTGTYNGYTVNFNSGNAVSASNGSNTNNGTWLVSNGGAQLNLAFSGSPFNEFNDEWDVFSVSNNRVEVRDVSGGGGGTDILVFQRV